MPSKSSARAAKNHTHDALTPHTASFSPKKIPARRKIPRNATDRFESRIHQFPVSLEWLTETGDAAWALRLGTDLFHFWENREYLAEGRDKLIRALNLPSAAAPTKARMRALFAAGILASGQRDYAVAEKYVGESIELARQFSDQAGLTVGYNALAVLRKEQSDLAGARKLFDQTLTIWRELDDQKGIAQTLSNLASVAELEGEYERSRPFTPNASTHFARSAIAKASPGR